MKPSIEDYEKIVEDLEDKVGYYRQQVIQLSISKNNLLAMHKTAVTYYEYELNRLRGEE